MTEMPTTAPARPLPVGRDEVMDDIIAAAGDGDWVRVGTVATTAGGLQHHELIAGLGISAAAIQGWFAQAAPFPCSRLVIGEMVHSLIHDMPNHAFAEQVISAILVANEAGDWRRILSLATRQGGVDLGILAGRLGMVSSSSLEIWLQGSATPAFSEASNVLTEIQALIRRAPVQPTEEVITAITTAANFQEWADVVDLATAPGRASYADLVRGLGVSRHTIRSWADGATVPSAREMPFLAEAMGQIIRAKAEIPDYEWWVSGLPSEIQAAASLRNWPRMLALASTLGGLDRSELPETLQGSAPHDLAAAALCLNHRIIGKYEERTGHAWNHVSHG